MLICFNMVSHIFVGLFNLGNGMIQQSPLYFSQGPTTRIPSRPSRDVPAIGWISLVRFERFADGEPVVF